jgi:hypothetical protein
MDDSSQPIFEVLFDHAEPSPFANEALAPYGNFGFPLPPADRPWIYSNFVQSLDGIASLLGKHATGADIAQSSADRWLMDLLRAYGDAVIMALQRVVASSFRWSSPHCSDFARSSASNASATFS